MIRYFPNKFAPVPHVAFVNSLRELGGAELWFLDAAQGLADRGLRVTMVAQPGSRLLQRARAAGLPTAAVPIRCDGAPWTLAALAWTFRRRGITALVCNLTKDLKAAGVAGLLAGVPVRLASRESDFPLKSKGYYRWYFTRAATGVLVNSEATRATIAASAPWLPPERVHLLPKGIDVARFLPAAAAPSIPIVGFVGQFIERKGLACLMSAWSQLEHDARTASARLRLAGEGPMRDAIVRWRETLRRPDAVELVGFVEDVPGFWGGCSVAVLPSRAEGFGLAAAEAAACALPVVATDSSSLPEIVRDGETGLLVPPDDAAALAGALARLLRDPALAVRLGAAGRRHITAHYDRRRCLDRLQELVTDGRPEATR